MDLSSMCSSAYSSEQITHFFFNPVFKDVIFKLNRQQQRMCYCELFMLNTHHSNIKT